MAKAIPPLNDEDIKRFWDKVAIGDPGNCWNWKLGTNKWGYGLFSLSLEGASPYLSHTFIASRVAFAIHHGGVSKSVQVLHDCDNPRCCNPSHLFAGTHADNMRDMIRKGRGNKTCGERQHLSKLTENKIREIRRTYQRGDRRRDGFGQAAIAKRLGVTQAAIGYIVRGKTWKHLLTAVPSPAEAPSVSRECKRGAAGGSRPAA